MTRKATRRKYRPPADPTSWAYAIARNWDMDQNHATKIVNIIRTAYQRMREGNGSLEDFDQVAAALNVSLIRAEKIGQPVVDGINAGQQALMAADRRMGEHGRYGFSGPDLLAMNCAMDLYEQILRNSTPRQMQDAMEESMRRMRAGQVMTS
jgi:hypothetical protein